MMTKNTAYAVMMTYKKMIDPQLTEALVIILVAIASYLTYLTKKVHNCVKDNESHV